MKHNKQIRRIALGLAVAAVVPATAQARPLDLSGSDVRAHQQAAVSRVGPVVAGPDDRAFSRQSSSPASVSADDNNGLDYGTGSLGGLVLILAAAGSAVVVHRSRKAKLSPA
jgi:hypothetical protein